MSSNRIIRSDSEKKEEKAVRYILDSHDVSYSVDFSLLGSGFFSQSFYKEGHSFPLKFSEKTEEPSGIPQQKTPHS